MSENVVSEAVWRKLNGTDIEFVYECLKCKAKSDHPLWKKIHHSHIAQSLLVSGSSMLMGLLSMTAPDMYYEVVNGLPESEIDQSALEELTRFVSVCNYALISFSISLREFTKWFLHGGWRTKRTKRFMKSMDFYLSLSRHNGDQSSIKNYFEVPDEINLVPLPVQRQQLPIAVQKPVVPMQKALVPTRTAPVRTQIPIKRPHVPPTVQGPQVCTQRVPTPQIAIQGQRPRVPPPVQTSQQRIPSQLRIPVPTQRFQEPTQRATRYDPSQIDQQLGGSSLGSASMSTGAFQATIRPVQDYGLNRVQDQLFDFYRNAHCSVVKQKSNLSQSIAFDQSTFSHHNSSNLTPHCPSLRKPLNLSFQNPAPQQKLPNQSDSMFYRNSTSTPFIKDTSNPNKLLYPTLYPDSTLPTRSIQHSNGTLPNFPRLLGPNHNLGDLRNGVVNNNRSIYPPQNFSRMPYRPKVSVSGNQAPRNQFANYDQAIHNQYPFGQIGNSHTKFAAENLQPKIGTNPQPKIYCYRSESNITQVLPAPSTNIPGPSAIPQQMRNEGNKVNVRPAELDLNIRAQDDGMPFTLGKPKFPSIASLLLHNSSVLNKSFQRTQFNQGRPELVHQENTVSTNPISFKPIHSNVPLIRTRPLSSEPILPKKSRPSSQIDRFPCPTTPPQNPLNMADWSGISFSPTEIRALMVPSPVKDDWIIRKDIFYTYENERSPGTFEKLRKVPGIFNSMKSLRECSFVLKKIRNGQYFIATVEITTDTTPQSKQPFTFYIQKLYHGNFKENLANQEAQMHQEYFVNYYSPCAQSVTIRVLKNLNALGIRKALVRNALGAGTGTKLKLYDIVPTDKLHLIPVKTTYDSEGLPLFHFRKPPIQILPIVDLSTNATVTVES